MAIHQSYALHFSENMPTGVKTLCDALASSDSSVGRKKPKLFQVFIWQLPSLMLVFSVCLFIVGVLALVWDTAWKEKDRGGKQVSDVV